MKKASLRGDMRDFKTLHKQKTVNNKNAIVQPHFVYADSVYDPTSAFNQITLYITLTLEMLLKGMEHVPNIFMAFVLLLMGDSILKKNLSQLSQNGRLKGLCTILLYGFISCLASNPIWPNASGLRSASDMFWIIVFQIV